MKGLCPFAALAIAANAVPLSEPAHRTLEHAGTASSCYVLYGEGYASSLACAGGHLASFMYTPFHPNTMHSRALREGPFPQDFLSLIAA